MPRLPIHSVACSLFRRVVCRWLVSARRTAIPNAFFVPTKTTSFLPRVIAVYRRFRWSIR